MLGSCFCKECFAVDHTATDIHILKPAKRKIQHTKKIGLLSYSPEETRDQPQKSEQIDSKLEKQRLNYSLQFMKKQLHQSFPDRFQAKISKGSTCATMEADMCETVRDRQETSVTDRLCKLGVNIHQSIIANKNRRQSQMKVSTIAYAQGDNNNIVYQQSIINSHCILDNFTVLGHVNYNENSHQVQAIEKCNGMIVTIKRINTTAVPLKDISHELTGNILLGNSHRGFLSCYGGTISNNNTQYAIIREHYSKTLDGMFRDHNRNMTVLGFKHICHQLVQIFNFLWEKMILLPYTEVNDVVVIFGFCKLINFHKWTLVSEQDREKLGLIYIDKLGKLLDSLTNSERSWPFVNMTIDEANDYGKFRKSVQAKHLNLKLLLRHPFLRIPEASLDY